jgi:hypothetical protein
MRRIDNPTPETCPTCGSSYLASAFRDGGSTLYCFKCNASPGFPKVVWTNPDWEINPNTGLSQRKKKTLPPTRLQYIAAETMRRFRERHS